MDKNFTATYPENEKGLNGTRCTCKPGYEGYRCEKVRYIVGCPPINPCLNDGKCIERSFGFSCICKEKYFGNRCQHSKTVLLPNSYLINQNEYEKIDYNLKAANNCGNNIFVCKNNGVCLETLNGFKCQCLPIFTGAYCERSKGLFFNFKF